MYRPLPIMFIASILASTAAWAEPQGHESRYQQNGGGHSERRGGDASHQQARPVERGGGGVRGGGDRSAGGYRGENRGPIGQVNSQRTWSAPQTREPAREPSRQAYVPGAPRGNEADRRYGGGGRDYNPRSSGPGNIGPRDNGSRYGRTDYRHDRPGNDRYDRDRYHDQGHDQGRDQSRYAGWTRGRDDWRDEHGRSWHHDQDWYQSYHYDHFRYYGDRYYARQRFSIGFYAAPWGYFPRVWVYGDRLPLSYYGDRFIVDDYYNYDLYAPPYATAWVRVGDDVLLVDLNSGEVLDVIANLFW